MSNEAIGWDRTSTDVRNFESSHTNRQAISLHRYVGISCKNPAGKYVTFQVF